MTRGETMRLMAMEKRKVFIGHRFNKLTIIKFTKVDNGVWCIATCDCDTVKELRFAPVKLGITKSCGCYNSESHSSHRLSKNPIYKIWSGIKRRCYYIKSDSYYIYGAKGITMCDEWKNNFQIFYDWCIENKWEKGLQIDRYPNNEGNYSPDNCRIVTAKVNSNNKTNNKLLNINGEIMTLSEASEKYDIPNSTLLNRLKKGMNAYDATHKINRNKKYRNGYLLSSQIPLTEV